MKLLLAALIGGILVWVWRARPSVPPTQDSYDPYALPFGEVVSINHMLGDPATLLGWHTREDPDGVWWTPTSQKPQ